MAELTWTETVEPFLGNHYELDRLWSEHQQLEEQLAELDQIRWPTPEQEQTRRTLQRTKLHGKDKMMAIARQLQAS